MAKMFRVEKAPTDELSLTNKAIFHPDDDPSMYMELTSNVGRFVVTSHKSRDVRVGTVALGLFQRKWLSVAQGDQVRISPYHFSGASGYLECASMFVEHVSRVTSRQPKELNTDELTADISSGYANLVLSVGQQMIFKFRDYPKALKLTVRSLKAADASLLTGGKGKSRREDTDRGILMPNTNVVFEAGEGIQLTGMHLGGASTRSSIISTDLDFVKMGIGGLDNEASILFRRAFASRVFPPQVIQRLGVRHIKGILLYGPPGCGKTLMARQIGQMLNAREPKIVNGPEILNKYVGESEANIRRLFQEAEEEQKRAGPNSGLHMIIFDEIDAICKKRGSRGDNTGVHDNVVTQLLSKMDGVDELDNILIIGMTNRKDLIDDALMRPGRFEVQMEIGLPNEFGRKQILEIHTRKIRESNMLADDVDLPFLAHKSINFSGAELAGLVRAATATAMNRVIKKSGDGDSSVTVNPEEAMKMKVIQSDFLYAIENDIKPMFGVSADQLNHFLQHGIVNWGKPFRETQGNCKLMIEQMVAADSEGSIDNFTSLLLYGSEGVGTSALAVNLALESGFTFIKVCSTLFMSGTTELAKVNAIHDVFEDAYRAHQSCVIVDSIENLIEYSLIGERYSSRLLQEVRIRVTHPPPKGHKLLVIGTTSNPDLIQKKMKVKFRVAREVKPLTDVDHIDSVLTELNLLQPEEVKTVCRRAKECEFSIGVKDLITKASEARIKPSSDQRVEKFLELLYSREEDDNKIMF